MKIWTGIKVQFILCTIDVVGQGLYLHIPHEGLEALKEALSNLKGQVDLEQQGSLNEDVLLFAELVLKSNNFEFNGRHYLQKQGTAFRDADGSFVCEHIYGQFRETFNSETCLVAVH